MHLRGPPSPITGKRQLRQDSGVPPPTPLQKNVNIPRCNPQPHLHSGQRYCRAQRPAPAGRLQTGRFRRTCPLQVARTTAPHVLWVYGMASWLWSWAPLTAQHRARRVDVPCELTCMGIMTEDRSDHRHTHKDDKGVAATETLLSGMALKQAVLFSKLHQSPGCLRAGAWMGPSLVLEGPGIGCRPELHDFWHGWTCMLTKMRCVHTRQSQVTAERLRGSHDNTLIEDSGVEAFRSTSRLPAAQGGVLGHVASYPSLAGSVSGVK